MPGGYGFVQLKVYQLGTAQTRWTICRANQHPRMKLVSTPTVGAGVSGAYCINTTGGAGAHWTCEHDDGRDAATTLGCDVDNTFYDWTLSTTKDNYIFEADEDVIVYASTAAGNGADCAVVTCFFQYLSSD